MSRCDICWEPGFLFLLCGQCKGSNQGCHLSCLSKQSLCPTCRKPIDTKYFEFGYGFCFAYFFLCIVHVHWIIWSVLFFLWSIVACVLVMNMYPKLIQIFESFFLERR